MLMCKCADEPILIDNNVGFINSIYKILKRKSREPGIRATPRPIVLLSINPGELSDNLISTKHFCELQMKQFPEKTPASIFRTYNPVVGTTNLFDFEAIESYGKKLLLAKWNDEPMDRVQELFVNQLEYKHGITKGWDKSVNDFKGRIIIVDYDATVIDGASEWDSEGFFDLYDLPPIDTWVYLAPNKEGRIDLYAWVPEQYMGLTKNAMEVNCLDLIKWFE